MTKTLETKRVEHALWNFTHERLGVYGCFEVTLGLGMNRDHNEIVDYITYETGNLVRCYEIKTSYEDFRSNARKSWWGHFNYLVTTPEVYDSIRKHGDILGGIGVYVIDKNGQLESVHRSARHQLTIAEIVTVQESMIRSLDREVKKFYRVSPY